MQAYAIVRIDMFQGDDCPLDEMIAVIRVFTNDLDAGAEVIRLNSMVIGKKIKYFVCPTRLDG